MTAEQLKGYTLKVLGQMAKEHGVPGWHAMRKDQLVKALLGASRKSANAPSSRNNTGRNNSARNGKATPRNANRSVTSRSKTPSGTSKTTRGATARRSVSSAPASRSALRTSSPAKVKAKAKPAATPKSRAVVSRRLQQARQQHSQLKDISGKDVSVNKDRIVVIVRDPYWLQATWQLTRRSVERAEVAMGQDWHAARPVLRLLEVQTGASAAETVVRDIEIHGGVNNWYVPVMDPPKSYRIDIGYLAENGRMFVLARSNVVSTPRAGTLDAIDNNWTDVAQNYEKIYAMSGGYSTDGANEELQELFEERLRRPMSSPTLGMANNGNGSRKQREFGFELDAELIVYGNTVPGARVTLQGDPVDLRADGSFTVRFRLPNCRQVIPAVACSSDGMEQRTIVLAVERNTKVMEPLVKDSSDL